MEDKNITFEDLPKAMSWMMDKLNKLDSKIDGLPSFPTRRSSDLIDAWLHDGKRKSQKELAEEAAQFINAKRNRPF